MEIFYATISKYVSRLHKASTKPNEGKIIIHMNDIRINDGDKNDHWLLLKYNIGLNMFELFLLSVVIFACFVFLY